MRRQLDLGVDEWILEQTAPAEALEAAGRARSFASSGRETEDPENAAGPTRPEPAARTAPTAVRPAGAAGRVETESLVLPDDLSDLATLASGCTRCRLAGERTQVVFADGSPEARVVVVGEAPGANEDRTGLPFVGAAGKLLDLLLASVDLSRRDSVYICNVIKCRPPGNRNPNPDEIEACAPYLRRQIALVGPDVILAVGTFAAKLLSGRDRPLGKLRGEVYAYEGIPLVVTYHPAALLRSPAWTRPTWTDLQLLRDVIDGQQS